MTRRLITALLLGSLCLNVQAQTLYTGANFHPHDYDSEAGIEAQINLMQQAGMNVARLGHLAWDSFEPSDGEFRLEWFDKVMDRMAEAGIKVILDIPVRPAPMWVHKACPGTTVVTFQGDTLPPIHRYYNDVGDPGYQAYAFRLAETLCKRYGQHPALLAFGIDNELGDGPISYSENVRRRFIEWLKGRYASADALNEAWAGWRWSRLVNGFDDVVLPELGNAGYGGNAERLLDFRRFLSDEILGFYDTLISKVNDCAPGIPTYTNAWYYSGKLFDYARLSYAGAMTFGGCGFYPGTALDSYYGMRGAAFGMARIQFEQTAPHWCAEFTTMDAAPGACRKQAYMSLMYGNQMVCGWTWQSMWGGEEQYLQGMLDWDGTPNYKYDEYRQIASEFKKIESWLPYKPRYEAAIALDFASTELGRMNGYPVTPHENQTQACFDWFYDHNTDVRIIDPSRSTYAEPSTGRPYKLVFLPGVTSLTEEATARIREYVKEGGTVVMTSRTAMTDQHGQVVKDTQPHGLADMFGIRLGGILTTESGRHVDEIELRGATVKKETEWYGKKLPLVTSHSFGKGTAVYVGVAANDPMMASLIEEYVGLTKVTRGPELPQWVSGRWTDSRHLLLLNHGGEDKEISLPFSMKSLLSGRQYSGSVTLRANDADFLEAVPVPTQDQIDLQDMEMYAFLHYSLNTYTDQEWGYGNEDPQLFNPSKLDTRQWVRTCKAAGMKGIIFTAKHHCGFCMWPSEYTDYSVKSSPWKNGQGDVVRELADACKEYGLKFALYLSPWDRNHPEYGRDEYVTYFRNQLRELLTNYGDVFEVWFDGANGGNGWYGGADETRTIDRLTYYHWGETYEMIRELQPHCVIWNDGADRRGDLRWVGTEAGNIGETNWSQLHSTGEVPWVDLHYGAEDGDVWVPGETNTSIRPGWFHHDTENSHVKSLSKLMDTYYKSVGRNSTLLLNFPITREGLIHPTDSARGVAFKKMIDQVFDEDLAARAKIKVNEEAAFYQATLSFKKPTRCNRFMVCEDIRCGQRVKKFTLEAMVDGEWVSLRDELAENGDGLTTIGRKRIICFPDVSATKLRFTVTDSKAEPIITRTSVYCAPELTPDIPDSGEKYSSKLNIFMVGSNDAPSRSIMIDLEGTRTVKGFRYLPPQQQGADGIITRYSLWSMEDNEWVKVCEGEFSNIVNNPIWQSVSISPIRSKLLRIDAESLNGGERAVYEDMDIIY